MKRKIIFFLFLLAASLTIPNHIHAEEKASGSSASFSQSSVIPKTEGADRRAKILRNFFQLYNSPLADNAETFVREADQNNIDWKLLPAISGVESTFGLAVPTHCNNAWGYNIYGDITRCFPTYDGAITTISHDIRHRYMDEWGAKDVYSIGRMYAASPTWAYRVEGFMQTIGDLALQSNTAPLPISL